MSKYIFITGGVVSSLGKGITAASLGRLLKNRGLRVTVQKLDPYLNVDPGTMSPYQHGEVFVTDDGAETDLDIGHYERFLDESFNKNCNYTSGKIYSSIIKKEREGQYLGATVQVVPHVTNEIINEVTNELSLEEQKEEVIRRSPFEVIKDSLRVYGSSYEEAVKMSQENLIIQQKLPICVRTIQEIIPISVFFPTESPTVNSNAWISLEAFSGYNVQKDGQLRIYLSDSQNISLDISNTTLCRQITHSKVLFKKATDLFTSVHSEPTNFVKKQSALWLINHLLQGVK